MPKTIIKVETYMCPDGIGDTSASCRFHRAVDNLTKNKKCPTCNLELVKATDDNDRITTTIIGEEDIEVEIEQEIEEPGTHNIDVSTEAEKTAYRTKRKKDIEDAIKKARLVEDK
jgi:hypothetical protein